MRTIDNDLIKACKIGALKAVKVLLSSGADVHANNDLALRWASRYGHLEVVKVLLAAGANVHADNDCALKWARENNRTEVVKVLAEWMQK